MKLPFEYSYIANDYFRKDIAQAFLQRSYAVYLITEVKDVHGNWVRYDYTNDSRAELTRIYSNDGRNISLNYDNARPGISVNSRPIISVTANNRTWSYDYKSLSTLSRVTLPDGRSWQFGDNGNGLHAMNLIPHIYYKCAPYEGSLTLKHPDGTIGVFELRETRHIRGATSLGTPYGDDTIGHYMKPTTIPNYAYRNTTIDPDDEREYDDPDYVPPENQNVAYNNQLRSTCYGGTRDRFVSTPERPFDRPLGWPIYQAMSIISKTIKSPNITPATWKFQYRNYSGGDLDNNWTKVTHPYGSIRTYTHRAVGPDHGLLKSIDVVGFDRKTEKIIYAHDQAGDGNPAGRYGNCLAEGETPHNSSSGACEVFRKRPVTKRVYQRDGDTYTSEYTYNFGVTSRNFSSRPIETRVYSNVSSTPRITTTEYEHNKAKWILALPKTMTQNGRELRSYVYNNLGQNRAKTQ